MKTLFKSIVLSVVLGILTTACVGGSSSASGAGTAGISSIGTATANGNSGSDGNEKYSPTSTTLITKWTLDGENTPIYNLYDMGWHVLTLTATQVIGKPVSVGGLIGTVEPNPLYHCGQTVQIQDINCNDATFANAGDHCSAYVRISYNYESYNYQQCDVTVKFQLHNFAFGNNVNISDRMQAQNSAADYRVVHDFESTYYSGSAVAANSKQYRIISLENGSPESFAISEITVPNNQAFTLMNRTESKGENDPYYGTWNQCTTNANPALGQVATLHHLDESCILVYQAAGSEAEIAAVANVKMHANVQNVFPLNSGNYILQADYNFDESGLQWQQQASLPSGQGGVVAYGDGIFVILQNNSTVYVSTNYGVSWQQVSLPSPQSWNSIAYGSRYGNPFFVVLAGNGATATSSDGFTWTQNAVPEGLYNIQFSAGNFTAAGPAGANGYPTFALSYDGVNWTVSTAEDPGVNQYATCNTAYYSTFSTLFCDTGEFYLTAANTWQQTSGIYPGGYPQIAYGGNIFVANNSGLGGTMQSYDGINWNYSTLPSSITIVALAYASGYGNNIFMGVSGNGDVSYYSADGVNWQELEMVSSANWQSIAYGGNVFIAVAGDGTIETASWIQYSPPGPLTSFRISMN